VGFAVEDRYLIKSCERAKIIIIIIIIIIIFYTPGSKDPGG